MAKFSEISQEVKGNWELYPLLLAVNSSQGYAYVTFGGLARPYDDADNIRGNSFVLCPSLFRVGKTSYYQITNDNLLYDYVAWRINEDGKNLENIDIDTEKNKEEQFSELRNSNDEFKKLFPEKYEGIRKTFDSCLENIANDNFADLTETEKNIGELKECFKKIIGADNYSLHYEGEERHCLPLLYNIEIAKAHKSDKNAYFDLTYVFLEKLHGFWVELLKKSLQKLEVHERHQLMNKLVKIMSYASRCIGYLQWKRLHEHLNKLLMPQTFLGTMYKTVCFSDSKEKFKEYVENLPGIVCSVETEEAETLNIAEDYFVTSSDAEWYDEDNWTQVINEDDFKDESAVKKYLVGLKKYSDVFKLSTVQVCKIQEDYKCYDSIDGKWYNIGTCINLSCWHLNKTNNPPVCSKSCCTYKIDGSKYKLKIHWQNTEDTFFYNGEALNTLKNLFAVRVLYETDWYDIAIRNRTFVSKAIRIFCETVMLALYRSGYIPAFYFEEKTVKGIKKRNIIEYFENTKKDEERITSSAVNFKFAKKFIEKLDPTVQASMKSIVRRLDILLQRTNPDMHGAEYFPSKHQLNRMLDYMQDISKEAYQLLDKKKKCLN